MSLVIHCVKYCKHIAQAVGGWGVIQMVVVFFYKTSYCGFSIIRKLKLKLKLSYKFQCDPLAQAKFVINRWQSKPYEIQPPPYIMWLAQHLGCGLRNNLIVSWLHENPKHPPLSRFLLIDTGPHSVPVVCQLHQWPDLLVQLCNVEPTAHLFLLRPSELHFLCQSRCQSRRCLPLEWLQ